MAKRDYYEILEVTRTASDGELKAAYRKLAMKWHPDKNPGDKDCEAHFKEINEAYDVLKDDQKRAAYDRFGHAAFEHGMGNQQHGFTDFGATFSDIFEGIFGMSGGARGRSGGRERGQDLRYNMEITLEEAYGGKTAQGRIPNSGTRRGCSARERPRAACQGRGQGIDKPCPNCSGSGRVTRERTLSVNVPAGVEDGTRIRLANEGEGGGRGGPAGDRSS